MSKKNVYKQYQKEMLDVTYLKNQDGEFEADDSFSWELIDYKEHSMDIQLAFENPVLVSSEDQDKVTVKFQNTTLLFDYFGQEIEQGSIYEKFIPPQFASAAEAEVFNSM